MYAVLSIIVAAALASGYSGATPVAGSEPDVRETSGTHNIQSTLDRVFTPHWSDGPVEEQLASLYDRLHASAFSPPVDHEAGFGSISPDAPGPTRSLSSLATVRPRQPTVLIESADRTVLLIESRPVRR